MPPEPDYATMTSDILLKGNLRKAKSWSKRFFVLKDGSPARLEYYENEKKWKSNNGKPKRRFNLERPWNIGKKKDTKHEFLIVIFTEEEYLSMAAENAEIQEQWYNVLQKSIKPEPGFRLFQYMWHVTVENKDLVGEKNSSMTSLHGPHRICLTHDQMVFIPATNTGCPDYSRGTPIEIPMTKIRVCGHKEGMFFIQPGRSSGIGHGNLWLDLGDEVMAANMHQTILKVMYALNQEEANAYRGRSFSSGSNAGRSRSVRSHHNNPPPSQIGMGKASNNRIRCDSLPVTNLNGANESRLRTGSEGEHTMKKPPRFCNVRTGSGSASPGMRSRKVFSHNKRSSSGQYHNSHHHYVSHSHSTSLSGSCNGSSPTSSTECLSMSSNAMEPLSASSSGYYTTRTVPNQSSLSISSDATVIPTSSNAALNDTSELQENQSFVSQQAEESYERHYCTNCFAHIPYFDGRSDTMPPLFSSEKAPSPPDIEPPHPNIAASNSSSAEYVNMSVHSRTQSADENMSSDTAFSSLSGSPQQVSFNLHASQIPVQRSGSDASSSSKIHSVTNASESLDEYTTMDVNSNVGKYPHQKMSGTFQKPTSSIFAKFASITGVSSDSRKKNTNCVDVDYTPMTPTTTAPSKTPAIPCNDYVPMRSFIAKHSTPQDISYRRRSIPDGFHRTSAGSSLRSSPSYDFSPADKYYETGSPLQSLCLDCQRRLTSQKSLKAEDLSYTEVIPGSARSDSGFKLPLKTKNYEISSESETLPPIVHVTVTDEPSQNSTANHLSNTISLQSFQHEVPKIGNSAQSDSYLSHLSSSPVATEINGYLPMNPINGHGTRKSLVSNILYVTENPDSTNVVSAPAQYPHQKRAQSESLSNSLDRSKRSPRTRRLKPFGARSVGSTKRTQSLRHTNKTSNENTIEVRNPPTSLYPASPPSPPPSPAGEYVNIDYAKAQEQLKLKSPHLVHSEDEENVTNVLSPKQSHDNDSEYAVMTFIDKEDNLTETTT